MADFTFAHREEGFDEHIEKSIRGYSSLMNDVISLSRYFVEDDTNIFDIGCSTGKNTKAMMEYNKDHSPEASFNLETGKVVMNETGEELENMSALYGCVNEDENYAVGIKITS